MQGKVIVIEGLDGSGKSTQFELLKNNFPKYKFITFPNYSSESGKIIKEYLSGKFNEPDKIHSAYSASSFYAIDRYMSYKLDWEKDYRSGKNIISARYSTSNAIYQMAKLDKSEWVSYCDWLYDYEYKKLGIPTPDAVFFLDMPVNTSQLLLSKRYCGNEEKKDIHEADVEFLKECRQVVDFLKDFRKGEEWNMINCVENDRLRTEKEILRELVFKIKQLTEED